MDVRQNDALRVTPNDLDQLLIGIGTVCDSNDDGFSADRGQPSTRLLANIGEHEPPNDTGTEIQPKTALAEKFSRFLLTKYVG